MAKSKPEIVLARPPANVDRKQSLQTPEAKEALARLENARFRMVTDSTGRFAFFLAPLFNLQDKIVDWCETACVDGKNIYWSAKFVLQLDLSKLCGLLCHEVMHPLLLHHTRVGTRDHLLWNIAGDLVINAVLTSGKVKLPDDGMHVGQGMFADAPKDATTEAYYEYLQKHQSSIKMKLKCPTPDDSDDSGEGNDSDSKGEGKCKGEGKGKGKQELWGSCLPDEASSSSEAANEEAKWRGILAHSANEAAKRGNLPAGLQALVDELINPKLAWQRILAEFLSHHAEGDSRLSYKPPNKRMMAHMIKYGVGIAKIVGEHVGRVVFAIDTSGSVDDAMLKDFVSEARAALSTYECIAVVLWHDCIVQGTQEIILSENKDEKLIPKGRGGTSHIPVFEYIDKNFIDDVTAVVCFSDMETAFPDREPQYPVLWVAANRHNRNPTAPWGRVINYTPSSR